MSDEPTYEMSLGAWAFIRVIMCTCDHDVDRHGDTVCEAILWPDDEAIDCDCEWSQ